MAEVSYWNNWTADYKWSWQGGGEKMASNCECIHLSYSRTHDDDNYEKERQQKKRKPGDELSINWLRTVPSLSEDLTFFWVCEEDICSLASMQQCNSIKGKKKTEEEEGNVLIQTAMVELSQHTGYTQREKDNESDRVRWKGGRWKNCTVLKL